LTLKLLFKNHGKKFSVAGVLGSTPRHTLTDSWKVHIYKRSEVRSHPFTAHRRLDTEDQIPAAKRFGYIRVPDKHDTSHRTPCISHRCR